MNRTISKVELCFFPFSFPPQEGGIHTWLYSICNNIEKNELYCIVGKSENSEEFDRQQSFKIIREPVAPDLDFIVLLKHVWHIGKNLFSSDPFRRRPNCSFKNLTEVIYVLFKINYIQFVYFIQLLYTWFQNSSKHKTDVVICGMILPPGLIAFVLKKFFNIPYVVFAYGAELIGWQKAKSSNYLSTQILDFADKVIVISRYSRTLVYDMGVNEKKIEIIYPGADTTKYHPGIDTQPLINKLNLKNNKIILTVSHLVDRKGHDVVIKSLPGVLRKVPNLKYVIVGQGTYRQKLEWLVEKLNLEQTVIFVGYVGDEELPAFYNMCDLFIMPSRVVGNSVEGFGISYIEANACSKPTIGGKGGGVSDAILDGITGFLVDPLDVEQIAETIILLLKDKYLAEKLGKNGLQRVEKELNWRIVAQKVRQATLSVLHEKDII